MAGNFDVFICGDSFSDINQYEKVADRGKKVAETYLDVAQLLVSGKREEVEEALEAISPSRTETFLTVCEKIAAFRQTLMSVFGVESPGYGLVLANLSDEHIQDTVLAVSEGEQAPEPPRQGEYKMAKKQTKQLASLLEEFYNGILPYQICFVVSRTSTGYKGATVAFSEPSSFAKKAQIEAAERLLSVSKVKFDTVWTSRQPSLPDDNEMTRARLQGIEFEGKNGRSNKQLAKIHAIALTCMLKTKNVLDGKLSNASRSALVLEITAVYNSADPLINYTFADEFIKRQSDLEAAALRYQTIIDALQNSESGAAKARVEMAERTIKEITKKLEVPQRALKLFDQYTRQDFWGNHCLPFLVFYRDHPPHAPVWLAVRVIDQGLVDEEGILGFELGRLDDFVKQGNIPDPPRLPSYAEVVSDSG